MKQHFSELQLDKFFERLSQSNNPGPNFTNQTPVHVVYGGAHLFTAHTPAKFGKIALDTMKTYAPDFTEFSRAMWLRGADILPVFEESIRILEKDLSENPEMEMENSSARLAWIIYHRTLEKLKTEPVEDFRIDFEDGYGFRPDDEEDAHAISASDELAKLARRNENTKEFVGLPFCGFRVKSFAPETMRRAIRTLDLFLSNLLEKSGGKLPENFVVTLPKITRNEEVEVLADLLSDFERAGDLEQRSIKIEIMIETPQSLIGENGEINLKNLVAAGKGRINSAHFGAYDYTAAFGISGVHQQLRHEACNFARQLMQISLAPLGIRLSDSVTIEMPIPVHRGEKLSERQKRENKNAVHNAWRKHFNNITNSLINGFYQSWDLHPAQLVARYAAVYAFFLESKNEQATRLKQFIEKATQAALTGNIFDDAASAQGLLNFFIRARNCGAILDSEILEITNLTKSELNSASFLKIMENRRKQ